MTSADTDRNRPEDEMDDTGPEGADGIDGQEEGKIPLALDIKVASPSACQRHITVVISREDIDRYFDQALTGMVPEAHVPGFRAGRAPRKLVANRFRKELADQVKGSLLMDSMAQITEGRQFAAISEPDFDFEAVELPETGPMKFEFDIEVRPEFDLPQWKGLTLVRPIRQFTKQDIDLQLEHVLDRHGTIRPHDGPAERNDFVVVDFIFSHEGKVISQLEEQTVRIKPILSFPDGNLNEFGKLMIGCSAGDTRQGAVQLCSDAAVDELQGKSVDVEIRVLEVKRLQLPDIDTETLQKLGGFESEGDLRDEIQRILERQLRYRQEQEIRRQIAALLTQSASWQLPPTMLRRQSGREMERAVLELKAAKFSDEEIRMRQNELRQNSLKSTATALKEHFILERIAEEEGIDPVEEDFTEEIARIAEQSRESPRRVRARLEKQGMSDALRNQVVERKVIELITSHAQFRDVPFEPEARETVALEHAIAGQRADHIPEAKHDEDARSLQQPAEHH